MFKEFKEFAVRGNVLDLAVAVVIGAAFGKIVTSLVNDIIMPIISTLTGGFNVSNLHVLISKADGDIPEVTLNYGNFIQNILDFVIIAFSVFLFIKMINKLKKEKRVEKAAIEIVAPPQEVILLQEIRDLLKK